MIEKQKTLANKTINSIVEKISTIYNFAFKNKLFNGKNPITTIKKLSENNERTRYLEKDEVLKLLNETKENNTLYIFTFLAVCTGARLKTICNIKVQDINLSSNTINLYDFKNKTQYKGFIKNDTGFINLLKKHMNNKVPTNFILGDKSLIAHHRYIQRNLSKILDRLFNTHIKSNPDNTPEQNAENRRNKVVVHTLRHTFGSLLAIDGVPIYTIKNLMNHKDINQTQRYAKLSPESGRNSINGIF